MKAIFLSWGMLILSVLFNAYGVFVIKLKLNEFGEVKLNSLRSVFGYFLPFAKSPLAISAIVLFCLAPIVFAIALSRMDIIIAYPVQLGLNFLILVIFAVLFLGEQLTVYKVLGMICVFVGIYFLSIKG